MSSERRPDGSQPGDDRLMMTSPEYWPNWPILTLKKKRLDGSLPDTGILYDCNSDDGRDPDDENISSRFRFLDDCILGLVTREELQQAPLVDIDDLLAKGWVVD